MSFVHLSQTRWPVRHFYRLARDAPVLFWGGADFPVFLPVGFLALERADLPLAVVLFARRASVTSLGDATADDAAAAASELDATSAVREA